MEALRLALADHGFVGVSTYIQSGNIIFDANGGKEKSASKIREIIKKEFGHDVVVMVLDKSELENILKRNPFHVSDADLKKLYVTFLAEEPSKEGLEKLSGADIGPDEAMVIGKAVYLKYADSAGKSKLSNALIENRLKVPSTARNWNTCNKLLELLC